MTPRYGPDIVGGAETLCRLMAENLGANGARVHVLTTCARDHFTWRNEVSAGESVQNGVTVRRFPVSDARDQERWLALHGQIDLGGPVDYAGQLEWMGNSVWSEEMLDAIADPSSYDWIVAMPYLFGTSYWAVAERRERTCLIPCVHDEPHAWVPLVQQMLTSARGCLLNSRGEADLIARIAPGSQRRIVGIGYQPKARPPLAGVGSFCAARGIAPGYLLYAGRREAAKGVPLLFSHYAAYRRSRPDCPPLALMGSGDCPIPRELSRHVVEFGYVPEDELDTAFAGASVLLHPSRLESLGMVLLEAWLVGTPALVNAESVVLSDHVQQSNGGLCFSDEDDFCSGLDRLLGDRHLREQMTENGARYVATEFSWQAVRGRFFGALDEWS